MPRFGVLAGCLLAATMTIAVQPASAASMTLSGSPAATATVGKSYYFKANLANTNSCKTCLFINGRPPWATFSGATGTLSGTPTSAGTWSNIRITAAYGSQRAAMGPFSITVKAASTIKVKISGTPASGVDVGTYYSFKPSVTSGSGVKLTYSVVNKPSWMQFSSSTGTLKGVPTSGNIKTYSNISVGVSDGKTSASLPAFKIAVSKAVVANALLSWTKPVVNTDGTKLMNLAGYRIHYGTTLGSLNKQFVVSSPGTTSASIEGLGRGTWFFAVVAYTTAGIESAMSSAARKVVN